MLIHLLPMLHHIRSGHSRLLSGGSRLQCVRHANREAKTWLRTTMYKAVALNIGKSMLRNFRMHASSVKLPLRKSSGLRHEPRNQWD